MQAEEKINYYELVSTYSDFPISNVLHQHKVEKLRMQHLYSNQFTMYTFQAFQEKTGSPKNASRLFLLQPQLNLCVFFNEKKTIGSPK